MAKPILPDDLKADMRAGVGASKFIGAKTDEVSRHAPAALGGDVDGIHDLRVATKRLREAIRLFSKLLPQKRAKDALVLAESLNDALGLVRDLDVMSQHAHEIAEGNAEALGFLGGLKQQWKRERKTRHREVRETWTRLVKADRFIDRLRDLAVRTARRKRHVNSTAYDRFAYLAITRRAEVVRARVGSAVASGDPDELHRVRIAVKRLKYTMEPFMPVLPRLADTHGPVSEAQESLGIMHDYDMLMGTIVRHASDHGLSRDASYESLLAATQSRRADLYETARSDVERVITADWFDALQDAID